MKRPAPNTPARLWIIAALAPAAALLLFFPSQGAWAYVAACNLVAAIPLGAAALLMIHHLVGTSWGDAIRPELHAACRAAPLAALVFLPLGILAPTLYPWATGDAHPYYHPALVGLRALLVLLLWALGPPLLARASSRVPPGAAAHPSLRAASAVGLILYTLSVTLAAMDSTASLTPHWHSSIFGVIFIASQLLAALAFATCGHIFRRGAESLRLRDLGSLLLAFSILHAYVAFSQYFIIWNGAIPHRTEWYSLRVRDPWRVIVLAAVLLQFILPFTAMLFTRAKRSHTAMALTSILVLIGTVLEFSWITLPSSPHRGVLPAALFIAFTLCLAAALLLQGWRARTLHAAPA